MDRQTQTYIDEKWGKIHVKEMSRARRLTFRVKTDGIHVTAPPDTTLGTILQGLKQVGNRLKQIQNAHPEKLIDWNFSLDTPHFKLVVERGLSGHFYFRDVSGCHYLVCPPDTCFNDAPLQKWLHKVIEEQLRKVAQRLLPSRLQSLSVQSNLPFESVRINISKSRWGSCSTKRHINLSCYLVLLPDELIDYVLLHELCHTREMNHGERFWQLMDQVTGLRTLQLRRKMAHYHTDFLTLTS